MSIPLVLWVLPRDARQWCHSADKTRQPRARFLFRRQVRAIVGRRRRNGMRAAYYESNGTAREVLRVGDVEAPHAGPGEVRVRLATSGVNPSDVKSRQGVTRKINWPRVIPQSDGAGEIDEVGDGVAKSRVGQRVWIWNGQWKRPFGTAAEYIALPAAQAVPLPETV